MNALNGVRSDIYVLQNITQLELETLTECLKVDVKACVCYFFNKFLLFTK